MATAALGSARRDHEPPAEAVPKPTILAGRAAADERRAALQAEADTEIAEMRRSAQAEIDEARAEALSGMRGDVSSLAVGAAQIVLGRDLDAGNQQSVIDQALSADSSRTTMIGIFAAEGQTGTGSPAILTALLGLAGLIIAVVFV